LVRGKVSVGEALVVAEVEVGLRAVFGDKDFPCLKGLSYRDHVQVRIAFLQGDFETATFEEQPIGRLLRLFPSEEHTAGNKNIFLAPSF